MTRQKLCIRLAPAMALVGLMALLPSRASAQAVALPAGVWVDAQGVLHMKEFTDPTGQLLRQLKDAARAKLNGKVATTSKLRMVSLNRLERALKERLAKGDKPTDEMLFLAGLTRVQYVFCMPGTKDIVIAGPAEGWAPDLSGRVCGIASGRPVIELQDLITALRAFPPEGNGAPIIGCSIDPTKEGLSREAEFSRSHAPSPTTADQYAEGLRRALGLQTVSVNGVPSNTHFAQVLVEADYRMKLIGIGLESTVFTPNGRPLIKSYVDRANPAAVARNAMQRWWFVPNYDCVRVSKDELAMELVGEGVKLVGADEVVGQDGSRASSKSVDHASHAFTTDFTKQYAKLADKVPVYAQLRNLIDLSVAAAYIQEKDFASKTDWSMPIFRDEHALPVQTAETPKQVETQINVVWKGTHLMTPIGGGVHIEPSQALTSPQADKDGKTAQARDKVDLKSLSPDQWWWD